MQKSSSATARVLAVSALVGSVIVLIAIVAANLGGGSESHHQGHAQKVEHHEEAARSAPATYVVKEGDTLTSIAHQTGVGVHKIERLNPEVDPQILIAGEKLKLR